MSIDYLNRYSGNCTINSIAIYAYIAGVDILVEAVQQLHRVFFSTSEVLFGKDRDIFADNSFGETDLEYFKTIRACFGAHPANLNEPMEKANKAAKRFASWSGKFGSGDFSVILYSNQIDCPHITLSIKMEQVFSFGQKYYDYLDVLCKEIERQYTKFCQEMRERTIRADHDTLKQLRILKEESNARLGYYGTEIDEMIVFFETPVMCPPNKELVDNYRMALTLLEDEIYEKLQRMELTDLERDWMLNPMPAQLPNGWAYWYGKMREAEGGNGYPPKYWLPRIKEIFGKYFSFSFESYEELLLLVNAARYDMTVRQVCQ